MFNEYKEEAEKAFPDFAERFAQGLHTEIKSDTNPASTQRAFGDEVGSSEITLDTSEIERVRSRLASYDVLKDRVLRILNSNFVKMTFPVFNALWDGAAAHDNRDRTPLRQEMVEGHILAIDLSEPMDRIVDRDEDLEYLDDYKLMNPYILGLARKKISMGGDAVLASFEEGFVDARVGQYTDEMLKSKPAEITEEAISLSYKKYRAVMGTAGKNMAICQRPLGEIFYLGMARAAEGAGCGNEIEDSVRDRAIKIPSWPLYYSTLAGDAKKGFELTAEKSDMYLQEARLAIKMLPDGFTHTEFLDFLFMTVDHYNKYWHDRLLKSDMWPDIESSLQAVLKN